MDYYYKHEMDEVLSRFLDKVEGYENDDSCWNWISKVSNSNYGLFSWNGHYWYAHRWIYLYCYGSLYNGRVVDHLCGNTLCVNPKHLEQISQKENLRRSSRDHRLNLSQ